jgi:hypothetical protein
MNLQQYLALKSELAAAMAFMHALAAQMDRLEEKVNLQQRNPVGRPRKENGEIATTVG